MKSYLIKLAEDYAKALEVLVSSAGEAGQDKITGKLRPGAKCAWCYKDDVEFWKSERIGIPYASQWPYRGFIIPFPETDGRNEMDVEHVCVVVTDYPVEKENPVADWGTLAFLIADERLYRFYVFSEVKPQS